MQTLKALLVSWGGWPCGVMVLAQWEAAYLTGVTLSFQATALTIAGTLAMYAADRGLERRLVVSQGDRHRHHPRLDKIMIFLVLGFLVLGLSSWQPRVFLWAGILAILGALYLAITVNVIQPPALVKEGVGSLCFTYLVWGLVAGKTVWVVAFFLMGLANFIWSGIQDRERDSINKIPSLAHSSPRLAVVAARTLAVGSGLLFLVLLDRPSWFATVALLHGFWPPRWPVDWAFLPLGMVLFRFI